MTEFQFALAMREHESREPFMFLQKVGGHETHTVAGCLVPREELPVRLRGQRG